MFSLRSIFRSRTKADPLEALRARLKWFRDLVLRNDRVLSLMAEAEDRLGGEYVFDMQYLHSLDAELAETVQRVVSDLAEVTDHRYPALQGAFERARAAVRGKLELPVPGAAGPLVVELEEVGTELAGIVGDKMARLGEVGRRLGLRVPKGFVLTVHAFDQLVSAPALSPRLASARDAGPPSAAAAAAAAERDLRSATLPARVERALARALRAQGRNVSYAVRSSALGEDGPVSFAGQFRTELNVSRDGVAGAYLRVVASSFGESAQRYVAGHGGGPGNFPMAVGCLVMVPAVASGVLFTVDPTAADRNVMLVSAAHGLGPMVVEGLGPVDRFTVSREPPHRVLERHLAVKAEMITAARSGGVERQTVARERQGEAAISEEVIAELARTASQIERYMRCPQDIEWAVDRDGAITILQTRPLRVTSSDRLPGRNAADVGLWQRVPLTGHGQIACRGVGGGTVRCARDGGPPSRFERGDVLVARHASPSLSSLVPLANALVTDHGSVTSHLATIAREHRVPALVGVGDATARLEDGSLVTVDAEENAVYVGIVHELLRASLLSADPFEDTAEFRALRGMLGSIAPLHLTDPASSEFAPDRCRTYHDIIRFAHEKALGALFALGEQQLRRGGHARRRAILDVPLDLVLIDLGGGIAGSCVGDVPLSHITSEPLVHILTALTAPGAWETGPADMDLAGFMSSAMRSSEWALPGGAGVLGNVAIVSANYLNLSLRLGYHFNVVDCCLDESVDASYVVFRFAGGVTELERRSRRARLLGDVLRHYGFAVERNGDLVIGRLSAAPRHVLLAGLQMIGRLIGFARQLDIMLRDDAVTELLVETFIRGDNGTSAAEQKGKVMSEGMEVMVLDDEPTVGERLKEYLEKRDAKVEVFVDSAAAIARLERKRFDVVVTDLKMKGPTGLDVLVQVTRENLPTQVIIMTGFANYEDARGAEAVGVFEFVEKPFHMDALYASIKKAAQKARKQRKP